MDLGAVRGARRARQGPPRRHRRGIGCRRLPGGAAHEQGARRRSRLRRPRATARGTPRAARAGRGSTGCSACGPTACGARRHRSTQRRYAQLADGARRAIRLALSQPASCGRRGSRTRSVPRRTVQAERRPLVVAAQPELAERRGGRLVVAARHDLDACRRVARRSRPRPRGRRPGRTRTARRPRRRRGRPRARRRRRSRSPRRPVRARTTIRTACRRRCARSSRRAPPNSMNETWPVMIPPRVDACVRHGRRGERDAATGCGKRRTPPVEWGRSWAMPGSNRRPLPCEGSALPAAPIAHVGSRCTAVTADSILADGAARMHIGRPPRRAVAVGGSADTPGISRRNLRMTGGNVPRGPLGL